MNRLISKQVLRFLFFVLLAGCQALAQQPVQLDYDTSIKVSARVDAKEVPLNRSLLLTVTLEWTGDLKRYQVSELENPILENFEIITTSAADRRTSEAGIMKAAKVYELVLKPKSIGMGYIEPLIVKYIDNVSGEANSLITSRLSAKVVDPVADPGSKQGLLKWISLAAIVIAGFVLAIFFWQKRKEEKRRKEAEAVSVVPLEQEFLSRLRETINLKSPDAKINEAFWALSRIVREYLSQKYQIPALESTSEKIVSDLSGFQVDQTILNNLHEILTVSDLAKFAGTEGNRSELDRVYTLVEALLERNIGENRAAIQNQPDVK